MIKYNEAIKIINKISLKLPDEKISTLNSLNRVCAKIFYHQQKIHYLTIQRLMVSPLWLKKQKDYLEKKLKNLEF